MPLGVYSRPAHGGSTGRRLWQTSLLALRPAQLPIDTRERVRVVLGACLAVALVAAFCLALPAWPGLPWLMAPLGASTVLVIGVPASPMAQPWSVVGGNTVSALVGLACVMWLPLPPWAQGAAAVALAIAAMLSTRCLHPPGGAVALLVVLGGVHDWHYALAPVGLNSLLLVLAGMAINNASGRRYPHAQTIGAAPRPPVADDGGAPVGRIRFSDADLDTVLARYNQVVDLPRDDLRDLLEAAEAQAQRRRMINLRCRDVMSADPVTAEFGTPLDQAWQLLHREHVKALPVVDRWGHVVGIVTQADFLRSAAYASGLDGLGERLRRLMTASPGVSSDKPEVVGQIMSRQVRVVSADRPIADLVPLFSQVGHHHIPVIVERNKLVGMITQTDVVAALARPT